MGALFAAPVAGLIQAFLAALWLEWRQAHAMLYPEEFGAPVVPTTTTDVLAPVSANERKSAANDMSDTASAALVKT
jgi:predicted RNase H-like nuclease